MKNNNHNDKQVQIVLDYIKSVDFSEFEDGKIDITDTIWANLQTYFTKEDALFEAHRKYVDVQYIISGNEKIGVADLNNCQTEISYNTEKDIEFLSINESKYIEMQQGDYLVLYPKDAHKPSISINEPVKVRKLVAKIPVD